MELLLTLATAGRLCSFFVAPEAARRKGVSADTARHCMHVVCASPVAIFPIGLGGTALVAWRHPAAVAFAALVLAFGDSAAALVGTRIPNPGWHVMGGTKSIADSLSLFQVSALLGCAFETVAGDVRLASILVTAAILTAEGSLGYGWDKLPLPATAAILCETLLGL